MSSKNFWEQKFEDYKNSHGKEIADLDYLDLASHEKVSNKELAYNLRILTFRNDLGNKVTLSAIHKCCDRTIEELRSDNIKLQKDAKANKVAIRKLQEVAEKQKEAEDLNHLEIIKLKEAALQHKPLSRADVEALVLKISEQPKFIEKQTEALIEELSAKVNKVEKLIHRLEKVIMGE